MTEVLRSKHPTPVPISMAEAPAATAPKKTTTTKTKLAPIVMPSNDRDLPPRRGLGPKERRRVGEKEENDLSRYSLSSSLQPRLLAAF